MRGSDQISFLVKKTNKLFVHCDCIHSLTLGFCMSLLTINNDLVKVTKLLSWGFLFLCIAIFVFAVWTVFEGGVIVVVVLVCIIRDESSQGRLSLKGNLHPCVRGSALCISHHLPLQTISWQTLTSKSAENPKNSTRMPFYLLFKVWKVNKTLYPYPSNFLNIWNCSVLPPIFGNAKKAKK